ncbi:tripartite tricarboxylate transporter substrate binding protein [Alcaligenaceae bacterium]|nr:tripartite tricarboxylate transporter substrate binding protein [Alcaligenaceae bacterium]
MKISCCLQVAFCCISAALVSTPVHAQDNTYPSRSVRMVVPFPAGQATDINARLLADRLSKLWGQAVYVDNRGGGAGIPGMMAGLAAAADGYTITFGSSSTTVVNAGLYPDLPYSLDDFTPLAPVFSQGWLVLAHPDTPYKNWGDVVDAAQKDPGKLEWGHGATALQLASNLLKKSADIDILSVNYKGSAATINDLAGGHIKLAVETIAASLPQIEAGRIKAIANLSDKRSVLLPEVPTIAEQGYPGFHANGWGGLFVPKGTPTEIITKISHDVHQILLDPEIQKSIAAQGSEADLRSREEWTTFIDQEKEKWASAIKEAGIQASQ